MFNEAVTFVSSSFKSAGVQGFGAIAVLKSISHYVNAPLVPPIGAEPNYAQVNTHGDDTREPNETFMVDQDILAAAQRNKGRDVTWRSTLHSKDLILLVGKIRTWLREHNAFGKAYRTAHQRPHRRGH